MVEERDEDIVSALKRYLLPVEDGNLSDAVPQVRAFTAKQGVSSDSIALYLTNLVEEWLESGTISFELKKITGLVLSVQSNLGTQFQQGYFDALNKLTGSRHLLSIAGARGLLSDALLVRRLLVEERMSSAQVAQVLNASQNTSVYTWKHAQQVASALGEKPVLPEVAVEAVSRLDEARDRSFFADADLNTAIELLADRAMRLGYRGDLRRQLHQFAPDGGQFAPAYSVILHVSALITEFFNHPLSQAAYEFTPRGGAVEELVDRVHKSYSASESPYLNNAKGAFAFDTAWAWGRKEGFQSRAHALVAILADLGAMPYVPRRELASLFRVFAHRLEALLRPSQRALDLPSKEATLPFLRELSRGNTATFGILEQRTIDFLGPILLPSGRWKGVGDSVNASNISRRKLGDLEVERPSEREIVAIEVHGGALTRPYVSAHQRTFARLLNQRTAELELVADPGEWNVTVSYVAHGVSGLTPYSIQIGDFTVQYEFQTFESFFEGIDDSDITGLFDYLVSALNERRVPQAVRNRFSELIDRL